MFEVKSYNFLDKNEKKNEAISFKYNLFQYIAILKWS